MSEDPTPSGDAAVTLDAFARMPEEDAHRLELVRGRVVREPRPGAEHGRVLTRLAVELDRFVKARGLGVVLVDVGVHLAAVDPRTVRGPDLAFVSREALPAEGVPTGFLEAAPDLAVEIVSPSDTERGLRDKVADYLHAGSREVWAIDPRHRRVTVHRSREDPHVFTAAAGAVLDGGDVLPGFRLPVARLFEE